MMFLVLLKKLDYVLKKRTLGFSLVSVLDQVKMHPPTVFNFLPYKISKEAVKIALQRTFAGL